MLASVSDIQSVTTPELYLHPNPEEKLVDEPPLSRTPRLFTFPRRHPRTMSDITTDRRPSPPSASTSEKQDKKSRVENSSASASSPPKALNRYVRYSRLKTEEWTTEDEQKLFDLIVRSKKYYYMYSECSKRYHSIDTRIMIPTFILNALIVSLNSLSLANAPYVLPIQLCTIVCTLIMTILYSIEKKCKYMKKAEQYHSLAIGFLECAQNAQMVLDVPRKARRAPVKCLYDLQSDQNKLLKVVMYVPSTIEAEYERNKDKIHHSVP